MRIWKVWWVPAALLLACAADPRSEAPTAPAVPAGINARYLDENLDVESFQETLESESREIARHRGAILDALSLGPGMQIADIGAGTGLFLEPFSERVGMTGKVLAVELSPVFRAHLRERAARAGLRNVEVIEATPYAARLVANSVDIVFICDTYHHFEYPAETLASLRTALRTGGYLVVIDFERIPGVTPDWIFQHVRGGKEEFKAEIEAAGFAFERELEVEGLTDNYVLRFRRYF